jgi:hypothetical protein
LKVVKLENEVVIEIVVGMVHESYKGFKKNPPMAYTHSDC